MYYKCHTEERGLVGIQPQSLWGPLGQVFAPAVIELLIALLFIVVVVEIDLGGVVAGEGNLWQDCDVVDLGRAAQHGEGLVGELLGRVDLRTENLFGQLDVVLVGAVFQRGEEGVVFQMVHVLEGGVGEDVGAGELDQGGAGGVGVFELGLPVDGLDELLLGEDDEGDSGNQPGEQRVVGLATEDVVAEGEAAGKMVHPVRRVAVRVDAEPDLRFHGFQVVPVLDWFDVGCVDVCVHPAVEVDEQVLEELELQAVVWQQPQGVDHLGDERSHRVGHLVFRVLEGQQVVFVVGVGVSPPLDQLVALGGVVVVFRVRVQRFPHLVDVCLHLFVHVVGEVVQQSVQRGRERVDILCFRSGLDVAVVVPDHECRLFFCRRFRVFHRALGSDLGGRFERLLDLGVVDRRVEDVHREDVQHRERQQRRYQNVLDCAHRVCVSMGAWLVWTIRISLSLYTRLAGSPIVYCSNEVVLSLSLCPQMSLCIDIHQHTHSHRPSFFSLREQSDAKNKEKSEK